jgi:hypothetical protein
MGVSIAEKIDSRPGSARDREIVSADVIVTCPARNFVTLKIVTRSGVTGIGDATLNGRELAVASYLKDHLVPNLIGRDAGRIEDIWQFFYRGAYWRRGPVTMTAIAAVDVALWDILGIPGGIGMAVRADDRQVLDRGIEIAGDRPRLGVGGQQAIGVERQGLGGGHDDQNPWLAPPSTGSKTPVTKLAAGEQR